MRLLEVAVDSRRKKRRTKIITKKIRLYDKKPSNSFFLLRASTVQFVTTLHPDGSVPVSLSVPEPTRTTDLAVSFYGSKRKNMITL